MSHLLCWYLAGGEGAWMSQAPWKLYWPGFKRLAGLTKLGRVSEEGPDKTQHLYFKLCMGLTTPPHKNKPYVPLGMKRLSKSVHLFFKSIGWIRWQVPPYNIPFHWNGLNNNAVKNVKNLFLSLIVCVCVCVYVCILMVLQVNLWETHKLISCLCNCSYQNILTLFNNPYIDTELMAQKTFDKVLERIPLCIVKYLLMEEITTTIGHIFIWVNNI